MKKLLLFVFAMFVMVSMFGQSSANYTFSTITTGSLEDMSTGTTTLLGAGLDDNASGITNMGFTFYFMGVAQTQFSVSSNGMFRFGNTAIGGTVYDIAQAGQAMISPFAEDLETSATGKVHYKLLGTSPNQRLVVEWLNMGVNYSSITADATYQLILYEGTGVIDFIYGAMAVGVGGAATGFQLGFSTNNTDNTFATITTATNTVNTTGTPASNDYTAGAVIPNLNSAAQGSRRVYTFTPPAGPPAPPTTMTFSSIQLTSMTVGWTDNSTIETSFTVMQSTDNITFTTAGSVPSTTMVGIGTPYSLSVTGLSAATTYYFQVIACNEGTGSAPLTGNQATLNPVPFSGTKTVGPTGNYFSLTAAFLDAAGNGINGPVNFVLQPAYVSTVETFPVLAATIPGSSAVNTITVYPSATGLSITSNNATGTLNLNGGSYITFDGRVNATGTTIDLIIENSATTGYAIQFVNEARNNTVKYCTVKGVNTGTSVGTTTSSLITAI
jgi:hypothetical protein